MSSPLFPLRVGDRVPGFALPDRSGQARDFQAFFRGEPVLLAVGRDPAALAAGIPAPVSSAAGELDMTVVGLSGHAPAAPLGRAPMLYDPQRQVTGPLLAPLSPQTPPAAARLIVLDANQRFLAALDPAAVDAVDAMRSTVERARRERAASTTIVGGAAPVLMLPYVFEPAFCARLIELWNGGERKDLGVSSRYGNVGVTMAKKTEDFMLTEPGVVKETSERLAYRISPELQRCFGFAAPFAFDAHVVLSYAADGGHHFRAHRDNSAATTTDRAFAVSLNLNDDFDGGELAFPEFGEVLYKPRAGTACVFSCTLLHEARPVTRGRRFVLTSFFRARPGAPAGSQPR